MEVIYIKTKKNLSIISSIISIVIAILPTLIIGTFSFFTILKMAKKEPTTGGLVLGFIVILISIFLAFTLQIIIHELGHMIFGLITGYDFLSFRIGKFTWIKQDGKTCFKKLPYMGSVGQCLMVPPSMKDGKIPYVLYNLGGSILNMIAAIIFLLLAIFVNKTSLMFDLLIFSAFIGISFIFTNAIPIKSLENDGYNVLQISKSPEALRSFWIQLKITEMQIKEVRPKDMPDEWFGIPSDESMKNRMNSTIGVLACDRMMDSMEFKRAEKTISKLIKMDTAMTKSHHNLMNVDLIYCYLVNNNGLEFIPEIIDTEFENFVEKMKNYPSVLRSQYTYELLWEKNYKKAEEIFLNFENIAKKYPYPTSIESEREKMLYAKEYGI